MCLKDSHVFTFMVGYFMASINCGTVPGRRNTSLCLEDCGTLEFCDEIEMRCSQCTENLCRLYSVPTECQQYCAAEQHVLSKFKSRVNLEKAEQHVLSKFKSRVNLEKVHDAVQKYHKEEVTLHSIQLATLFLLMITFVAILAIVFSRFRALVKRKDYIDKPASGKMMKNNLFNVWRSGKGHKDNGIGREIVPIQTMDVDATPDQLAEGLLAQVNDSTHEEVRRDSSDSITMDSLPDHSHLGTCQCQPSPLNENL